jgi:hypothetical protein
MLSYNEAAAIAAAPTNAPVDAQLKQLLVDRVHDWTATELLELTHLLIVQPGDGENEMLEAVGYSPLVNTLNGKRFGQKGYSPQFDWLQDHCGWFELIQTVSNDGFAFVIFVPDREGTDPELHRLCRTYAE